ncbi:hypothetical protein MMC28_005008 [Mycoblastus sanguinarius]|nr:hypothetical protein [Mycoblastus sanguinarius]
MTTQPIFRSDGVLGRLELTDESPDVREQDQSQDQLFSDTTVIRGGSQFELAANTTNREGWVPEDGDGLDGSDYMI